jgi:hypothetical protein
MSTKKNAYDDYMSRYAGKSLLEKHSLDEEGIWEVRGEDPNCDLGGYHHEPSLGFYTGKLKDVVMMGVELPRFWVWGAGGSFKLIKLLSVSDGKRKAELMQEKRDLEKRIQEIDKELK